MGLASRLLRPASVGAVVAAIAVGAGRSAAQNLHNMVAARGRVLSAVHDPVVAIREDAAGRIYVLTDTGHSLLVFDSAGIAVGQFPAAGSGTDVLHFAVDFDIAPNGTIVVADRGTNAVDIFAPDGSLKTKVSVFAPTSVVALSNGQFAVTTLRTGHPVEVIDQAGRLVRGFGESHPDPAVDQTARGSGPLADSGRIVGDSADNLYFGVFSDTAPEIRKYDRFGYAAYAAAVPTPGDLGAAPDDRVQFGFNFARLSRSSQISSWTTIGNTGDVHIGSEVGGGLTGLLGAGRRYRQNDALAGSIEADTSVSQPTFDLHVGAKSAGRAVSATGQATQSASTGNTAALAFADSSPSSIDSAYDFSGIQLATPADDPSNTIPGTVEYMVGNPQPGSSGPGVGGFSSFFLGGLGPRPGAFGHPIGLAAETPGENARPSSESGPGRGHFGASNLSFLARMTIALTKPRQAVAPEKRLTALGVDHRTQEVWAAVGPMLVHFTRDGDPAGTFYLTGPDGATIDTSAIVVEPDRLLVAASSGGVYEFGRPDKPSGSVVRSTGKAVLP